MATIQKCSSGNIQSAIQSKITSEEDKTMKEQIEYALMLGPACHPVSGLEQRFH
jgi:hypothetical protein